MISFSRKEFENLLGGGMCARWGGGAAGGYRLCVASVLHVVGEGY